MLEVPPMAREGWKLILVLLRCSLDARTGVLQTGRRDGCFGFSKNRRRWVEVSVAPRAERRVPVGSWESGEGFWKLGLDSGGLWWIFAGVVDFGQKWR